MDGQACLRKNADIRRATASEGHCHELTGTANSVSCELYVVSQRIGKLSSLSDRE